MCWCVTGPNEITIFTPKAIPLIHGPTSVCTKTAWYDNIHPIEAVVTTRSRKDHDKRAFIWDQGYSIKALREHEESIFDQAKLLQAQLAKLSASDQVIDITEWLEYYGFDVMGVVQYSKSFGMLKSGQSHWVLDTFKGGTKILGYMTSVPWLIHIVHSLPLVGQGFGKYKAWATKSIYDRIDVSTNDGFPTS